MFEKRDIYCHVRFSYYGITDTRLKLADHDEAHAILYDETRMARRFFLFENLTLPSLRAQTDQDFKIVIMSSDIMPDRFKDRLRAITAHDHNVTIDFSDRRNGAFAYRKHIEGSLGEGLHKTAVHFRLDDDDALCETFVARLRAVSYGLSAGTHITFPTGITVFPKEAGSSEGACAMHRQYLIGLGLAIVCDTSFRKNPFQMMHGDVWQRWPVVSDPRLVAFIRSHHHDNDTLENQDKVLDEIRRLRFGRRSGGVGEKVDQLLAENFSFIDQPTLCGLIGRLKQVMSLTDLPSVG